MRILLLSSLEHQSGSALRFRGIAGALARRGHEVHLVEPAPPGSRPETPEGVVRHPCPRLPGSPVAQAPLWLLAGLAAVRRVRPQAVYALKALPNVWVPGLLARRRGAPLLVDLDDLDFGYYPPGLRRSLVRSFFQRAVEGADLVTVHNEAMRRRVDAGRGRLPPALFVDQGIEVERFAQARAPDGLAERLGVAGRRVILYAGHLGPASDLGPLVPALQTVASALPDARLLVVGDGICRAGLEEAARRHLPAGFAVFAGTVPHREVPGYYALADVAVNYLEDNEANRYRASIKTREAMAAGVAVVSSDTADTRRFADLLRMPAGSGPAAFADAVLEELTRPDPTRVARAKDRLLRFGGWDAAAAGLAEALEQLARH